MVGSVYGTCSRTDETDRCTETTLSSRVYSYIIKAYPARLDEASTCLTTSNYAIIFVSLLASECQR